MAEATFNFTAPNYSYPATAGGQGGRGYQGNPGQPGGNGQQGGYGANGGRGLAAPNAICNLGEVTGKIIINAWGGNGQDGGAGGRGGDGGSGTPDGAGGRGGDGGASGDGGDGSQVLINITGKLPIIEINTGQSLPGAGGKGGAPGTGNGNLGYGNQGKVGEPGARSVVTVRSV
jgi:hypothetical protein